MRILLFVTVIFLLCSSCYHFNEKNEEEQFYLYQDTVFSFQINIFQDLSLMNNSHGKLLVFSDTSVIENSLNYNYMVVSHKKREETLNTFISSVIQEKANDKTIKFDQLKKGVKTSKFGDIDYTIYKMYDFNEMVEWEYTTYIPYKDKIFILVMADRNEERFWTRLDDSYDDIINSLEFH